MEYARRTCLVKVMGMDFGAGDVEGSDVLRFHVDDAVLILEKSFDAQEAAASDYDAVALENVRGDDYIGDTGFVLEREENKTLCRARALARDDATGYAHKSIVGAVNEVVCRMNSLGTKNSAVVSHRVRADGESRPGVVGSEALVGCHSS